MTTAAALKDEICARSNSRKRATVEGLWQVLEGMRRKGIKAFTIAQVGRHAEAADVLRTQTLRNTGGEDYRFLIEAFAQEIADLDIRTRMRMVLVENGRLHDEVKRLRQAFKYMQLPNTVETPAVEVLSPTDRHIDIVPLEQLLSTDWVDERRWSVEANGAIHDEDGFRITPVGFVDSLQAVLDLFRCKK
jgi:hypothetical protein